MDGGGSLGTTTEVLEKTTDAASDADVKPTPSSSIATEQEEKTTTPSSHTKSQDTMMSKDGREGGGENHEISSHGGISESVNETDGGDSNLGSKRKRTEEEKEKKSAKLRRSSSPVSQVSRRISKCSALFNLEELRDYLRVATPTIQGLITYTLKLIAEQYTERLTPIPIVGSETEETTYLLSWQTDPLSKSEADHEKMCAAFTNALRHPSECNGSEHSLDVVFRLALKEISTEMNEGISVENPALISGGYLELRLLQKIRTYYSSVFHHDILDYFTNTDQSSKIAGQMKDCVCEQIAGLVKDCVCEPYIRVLHDRYNLRENKFDAVLKLNERSDPQNMRVWTDRTNQRAINALISSRLSDARTALISRLSDIGLPEEEGNPLLWLFTEEYRTRMSGFIKQNAGSLSEILRSSELMSWICFGITLNDTKHGNVDMALSYFIACGICDTEQTDRLMCWNYPLASAFRPVPGSELIVPIIPLDWNDHDVEVEETLCL